MQRRTKIVATLGPATVSRIDELVSAGVDVVRINLSHGVPAEQLERLGRVRAAARDHRRHVGVLVDLPGPKIRVAAFPDGGRRFVVGERLALVDSSSGSSGAESDPVVVDHPGALGGLQIGDRVVLGDGLIAVRVDEVSSTMVGARVESGGTLHGRPGLHVPAGRSNLRTPTEHDLALAEMAASAGADFIAVSFVRRSDDLLAVREVVGRRSRLVAKIETADAVTVIDDLVEVCDAVMIARGDLGIDLPLEDVPHVQKQVIDRCRRAAVPVITATQMLESMTSAPSPTRAEVSDVANAVLDGTDAVMLSAETAIGAFPIEAVTMIDRIARRAESGAIWATSERRAATRTSHDPDYRVFADPVTVATTEAANRAAVAVGARIIACVTRAGRTAAALSCQRPAAAVVAMTAESRVADALSLMWGVTPIEIDEVADSDDLVDAVVGRSRTLGLVESGDHLVVVAGTPGGHQPVTDLMRVVSVR